MASEMIGFFMKGEADGAVRTFDALAASCPLALAALSASNPSFEKQILSIPLYMIKQIPRLLKGR